MLLQKKNIDRTRLHRQTDIWTDGQTDIVIPIYFQNIVCGGGYNNKPSEASFENQCTREKEELTYRFIQIFFLMVLWQTSAGIYLVIYGTLRFEDTFEYSAIFGQTKSFHFLYRVEIRKQLKIDF